MYAKSATGVLTTGCAASGVKLARTLSRLYCETSENDTVLLTYEEADTSKVKSEVSESDLIIVVLKVL